MTSSLCFKPSVHVPISTINARDRAGMVFMAVLIPCLVIGVLMCFSCRRSRDRRSRPPPSQNLPTPNRSGGAVGSPAPVSTQATAPLSVHVPDHTASSHRSSAPPTRTQSTTSAQGAVQAAGLPKFEQDQLLQQNGAMGSIITGPTSTPSVTSHASTARPGGSTTQTGHRTQAS